MHFQLRSVQVESYGGVLAILEEHSINDTKTQLTFGFQFTGSVVSTYFVDKLVELLDAQTRLNVSRARYQDAPMGTQVLFCRTFIGPVRDHMGVLRATKRVVMRLGDQASHYEHDREQEDTEAEQVALGVF